RPIPASAPRFRCGSICSANRWTGSLTFGIGGSIENLLKVARKELSLLWINPNAPLALAYKGCAPFDKPQPLRTIAVFPSWDAAVIAVHESTGITSIEQIRERK